MLSVTGGTPAYSWSLAIGALPAGLSLSAAGVSSGASNTAGTSNFTVGVTDSGARTALQALSITINPALSITTTSLPVGVVSAAYSATLVAAGGTTPYTWAVTVGTLPAGLSLNASTGAISGIPTTPGTSSITVQVTDSGLRTATQGLS